MHDNDPDDPGYRAFLSRLWDVLRPRLRKNAVGLDYGCGPGPALASMIREDGFAVEKYDLYFFPDRAPLQRKYDFITCTETVEHLRRPMAVFNLAGFFMLADSGQIGVMTGILDDRSGVPVTGTIRRDPTHIAFYGHAPHLRWVAERFGWDCGIPGPERHHLYQASLRRRRIASLLFCMMFQCPGSRCEPLSSGVNESNPGGLKCS